MLCPALQIQDSRQFHEWLFSTHLCYAASRQVRRLLLGVPIFAWPPDSAIYGNSTCRTSLASGMQAKSLIRPWAAIEAARHAGASTAYQNCIIKRWGGAFRFPMLQLNCTNLGVQCLQALCEGTGTEQKEQDTVSFGCEMN